MQVFPEIETTFLLPGPSGVLEVLVTPVEGSQDVAVICHPHPLFSGTMHNKVVTTLARTFKDVGMSTVRFNFRGVGKSEGVFDKGVGELDDLFAVMEWVKRVCPERVISLAGFSFGSYVAAKGAIKIPVKQLICVAPPVINFAMGNLPAITCPWVVVQGDQDDVVAPEAVFEWVEKSVHKPVLIRLDGAGHFFHGRLLELRERLEQVLIK